MTPQIMNKENMLASKGHIKGLGLLAFLGLTKYRSRTMFLFNLLPLDMVQGRP
jgi:hypothetical protein